MPENLFASIATAMRCARRMLPDKQRDRVDLHPEEDTLQAFHPFAAAHLAGIADRFEFFRHDRDQPQRSHEAVGIFRIQPKLLHQRIKQVDRPRRQCEGQAQNSEDQCAQADQHPPQETFLGDADQPPFEPKRFAFSEQDHGAGCRHENGAERDQQQQDPLQRLSRKQQEQDQKPAADEGHDFKVADKHNCDAEQQRHAQFQAGVDTVKPGLFD